jgi:Transposase DDE domain
VSQLDSTDRQGEVVPEAKITRLNEKIATLRQEIQRLNALNAQMMQTEDKQISLTDPDARSMATSGRGSGMVGYNVQSAVDTKHHLIVTHEVTNVGSDRSQLSRMSEQARAAIGSETIEAVADRGYYSGEEIVACEQAGVTVYLPKPMTSGLLARGRFGKQDFVYVAADDVYLCPAGEQLTYHYTNEEEGKTLRRYWTTACPGCALKSKCTTGKERRISRWEYEAILEAVQARLDRNPAKMRERRQTVEHPFGTIKSWMGATHFQMKTLKHVGTEMALHVPAYNMKRVMRILGVGGLIEAIRA